MLFDFPPPPLQIGIEPGITSHGRDPGRQSSPRCRSITELTTTCWFLHRSVCLSSLDCPVPSILIIGCTLHVAARPTPLSVPLCALENRTEGNNQKVQVFLFSVLSAGTRLCTYPIVGGTISTAVSQSQWPPTSLTTCSTTRQASSALVRWTKAASWALGSPPSTTIAHVP